MTDHNAPPSKLSTRPLPAQFSGVSKTESSILWYQKTEENMGFKSRAIIFMALVQLFWEKYEKLKRWHKKKIILSIIF